jgi:hypothetical protein
MTICTKYLMGCIPLYKAIRWASKSKLELERCGPILLLTLNGARPGPKGAGGAAASGPKNQGAPCSDGI